MRRFCVTHVVLEVILLAILDSIVTIGLKSRGFRIPMSGNKKIITDNKTQAFLKTQFIFIENIIEDLRSDLSIRLTEQQSILESAKSEVEKNIQ